jgi:type IV secretory pathway VirB10-like protein
VPKNEDGEFELILGNRQLLTVFFIVVVLFGIFFAMGYILGRPAGPSGPEVASAKKAEKPLVVESPARDANPAPPAVAKSEPPPPEKPKPEPVKEAEPEKSAPKPEPVKAEAPKPEKKKSEPKQSAKAEKSKPEPATAAGEPPSGTYLQLAAVSQHEASLYVDVLKKKGFKAVVAPIPENPVLFRVVVGPLTEANLSKTRNDLKAAGFPGDRAFKKIY